MNKKGFTLVELLAVIVILGLLVAIINPVVKNLLNDSKDSLSDQQKKLVVEATKKYMIEHSELLPEGSNRSIIYMSDLIDKGVIDNDKIIDPKSKEELNGCVVVSYNDSFNQYEYNYSESDCLITVTFDPEGGNVDTTSKQVTFNSTYGELPTPTREGYTFKGWRGKNMFDEESILMAIGDAEYIDGHYVFEVGQAYQKYKNGIPDLQFNENTQYIMTIKGYTTANNTHNWSPNFRFKFKYTDETEVECWVPYNTETTVTCTSTEGKTIDRISMYYGYGGNVYISHIQLEEGTTATEYEPYQEYSSDTIVTKGNDHTLHAIWEVAS